MYAIHATVTIKHSNGFSETKQIPMFYLDENVQGITNPQRAVEIAKKIIMPVELDNVTVNAEAYSV